MEVSQELKDIFDANNVTLENIKLNMEIYTEESPTNMRELLFEKKYSLVDMISEEVSDDVTFLSEIIGPLLKRKILNDKIFPEKTLHISLSTLIDRTSNVKQ